MTKKIIIGTIIFFLVLFSVQLLEYSEKTYKYIQDTYGYIKHPHQYQKDLQKEVINKDKKIVELSEKKGIEYSLIDLSGHISGYEVDGEIIVPAIEAGNSTENYKLNTIPRGKSVTIPLYIDNTF